MQNIEILPPTKLRIYPHMFPHDIAIWERFLAKYAHEYDGFAYDTKVGSGTRPAAGTPENFRRMQSELSKYRIDAIGMKPGLIEIMEVKPRAAASALGQVVTYINLFVKEHAPNSRVVGAIVTDTEMPDMRDLTSDYGFNYYIV